MELSHHYDAPINKVLHFIRSVASIKGKHNRSLKVTVQGPDLLAHPSHIEAVSPHVDKVNKNKMNGYIHSIWPPWDIVTSATCY
jgi:hypothetical protein